MYSLREDFNKNLNEISSRNNNKDTEFLSSPKYQKTTKSFLKEGAIQFKTQLESPAQLRTPNAKPLPPPGLDHCSVVSRKVCEVLK